MRLRELFPRVPMARLVRLMGRSEESIRRQAEKLFARRERVQEAWTERELNALRRAFGVLPDSDLALFLGRSVDDVAQTISRLRNERRQGAWSREEIVLLKQVFGSRSESQIVVCLSRDRDDIAAKAKELCLGKDKGMASGTRMPRWSSVEVARLRELYPDRTNLEIARILGRSVTSIANKAHQLGLCKSQATLRRMGRENVGVRHRAGRRPAQA